MRPVIRPHAAALLSALCLGCGDSPSGLAGSKPVRIVVEPARIEIRQQESQQLVPSVVDAKGTLITGVAVEFSSPDTTLVRVSRTGVVSSVGRAGSGAVRLASGNLTLDVPVTVHAVANGIVVTPNPVVVPQKGTTQLTTKLIDLSGAEFSGTAFSYTVGDPGLISVSPEGFLTSLGPAGTTTLFIVNDTLSATVPVAVTPVPTTLSLMPSPINVPRGMSRPLFARVLDAVGAEIPNVPITFASSNNAIVTVSAAGVVTSAGPLGAAKITARSGALSATGDVSVIEATHPGGTLVSSSPISGSPFGVAVSPAGVVYVARINGAVTSASLSNATFANVVAGSQPSLAVDFSPSGATAFATNSETEEVDVIDVASGTVTGTTDGITGTPFALIVSPDGRTVYVGTSAGSVFVVNAATRAIEAEIEVGGAINHFSLHPAKPLVYATSFNTGKVVEINTQSNTVARTLSTARYYPQGTAVSPDGTELYVAAEYSQRPVYVYDLTSLVETASIALPGSDVAWGLAQSPDGEQLYVSAGGAVHVIDRATRTVVKTITVGGTSRRIAFSLDGSVAVVANEYAGVHFIR